jgi:hypothetical protein
VTDLELGAFLSGPPHPEQEALLRVIAASIIDPHGTAVEDQLPVADTRREWSDAELTQLGNLLVRGLSIQEIAHLLGRDHGEVQDKVVEIGRACRGSGTAALAYRWFPCPCDCVAHFGNPSAPRPGFLLSLYRHASAQSTNRVPPRTQPKSVIGAPVNKVAHLSRISLNRSYERV